MTEASRARILLVEDEESIRRFALRVLESAGYEVLLAPSAEEGLRAFDASLQPVGLLITDVTLPGRSGFELAADVVARRPDVRILFISGYGDRQHQESRSWILGAAFLGKPFTSAALVEAVAVVLEP